MARSTRSEMHPSIYVTVTIIQDTHLLSLAGNSIKRYDKP